jgi:hypothetical protein
LESAESDEQREDERNKSHSFILRREA